MGTVPAASRDRLSDLPDCLLHTVLSSLRSRQVVHTCLLSKPWRHMWRSVPCLHVDQREFLLDGEPDEPPASDAERLVREVQRQRSFEDFADVLLVLHGVSPIDACCLRVADRGLRTDLPRWIRRGLARHPTELCVAYDGRPRLEGLMFSFYYASGGAGALSVTSRLRKLHLSGLTLTEEFEEELRSECPVLEDLTLVGCEYDYKFRGRIASTSLKTLHVEGLHGNYDTLGLLRFLAAPALVSLYLDKVCLPEIEEDFHSLAVASVADPSEYRCEYRFLESMRDAKFLELRSFTTTGLLAEEPETFREFHNLRMLILIECDIGDRCQVVRYILENVPNLESLVLEDCKTLGFCRGESASSWHRGTIFHGCKNLKSIQVKYKDHDVPHVLVAALTQIAKDIVKPHHGERNYVGWLDWMGRVVGWQNEFLTQGYAAASAPAESDNSLSDEEHGSNVWKHHARKKHNRDCAGKARRRAAHLARR